MIVSLLAEAIPPTPIVVNGLAALFILAAVIVAVGLIKLVDALVRGLFGTISGAVGWIPYAGRVLRAPVHKIEQKVTHALGAAERRMDALVATSWHNLAHLVTRTGHEIAFAAQTAWHLSVYLNAFATLRHEKHAIRTATRPLRAGQASARRDLHNLATEQKALHKSVAQGVYPRLKAGEVYDRTVTRPSVRSARAEAKTAEDRAIAMFKWLTRHKLGVGAAVFTGAVAWALGRLGGSWIRCKNWRQIGRHVCGLPNALIAALLGLGLAFAVVIDPRKTAKAAEVVTDSMDSLIRRIAD